MTLCILGVILAQGFWLYRDYRYYKSQPFFSSDYDFFLPATHAVLSVASAKTMVIDGNQIGANTIIAYPSGTVSAMMPLQTVPVQTIPALPMAIDFSKSATLSEDTSMFSSRIYPASPLAFKSGQTEVPFGDTLRYTDRIQSGIQQGRAMPVEFARTTAYKAPASYIFNKMKWQFGVSVLLIVLTTCSLAYMLVTIFRQQRMSLVKNDFINSMAHELKTPLATISVAVEAIKRYGTLLDKNKTERYLEISTNEINHLSKLIELILQESIFDNDKMVLHKESTDVNALIHQILENYSIKNAKAVDIRLDCSHEIPALLIDPLHLSNSLRNIIDNAIKYASDEVIIRITSAFENGIWRLSISDTGIGIPEKYHDDIFERFFRVSSDHDATGSFGLGLSYVKKVVELHEGSIGLESKLSIGSTFLISIPFKL
ncbi:HAMP domain-containing histidine kinase [Pedobacter steynii]|nr:HAMP domain-containing sensor histidine kinase [Pedobacter steynii]NQX41624.1 HAMP domain-containing histidine kinase [Pedobacter steynii]